ncbi:hypothetical protein DFH07DRAFT_314528 [Mycena maculata]|uniref:Uncharacterized protein n=1 Tax=Mycena maculata TaxID=230809 RepID=A0AAD7MJB2_9AGAR|nr:hypothetical protein DFH07DRAFT_314528 [Mycena maculata]
MMHDYKCASPPYSRSVDLQYFSHSQCPSYLPTRLRSNSSSITFRPTSMFTMEKAAGVLYGIYAALFAFYLHVLRTRGISKNRFLTVATISLFVLCSTHFALLAAVTVLQNRSYEGELIGLEHFCQNGAEGNRGSADNQALEGLGRR